MTGKICIGRRLNTAKDLGSMFIHDIFILQLSMDTTSDVAVDIQRNRYP